MWATLTPVLVEALALIIPGAATLILALVTRATLRVQAAKQAATAVEFSPLAQAGCLSSEQKLQLAIDQVRTSAPLLARMSETEAARLVERVLPDVRRLSDPSQLKPSSTSLKP